MGGRYFIVWIIVNASDSLSVRLSMCPATGQSIRRD